MTRETPQPGVVTPWVGMHGRHINVAERRSLNAGMHVAGVFSSRPIELARTFVVDN
jgi:hypothetical protein